MAEEKKSWWRDAKDKIEAQVDNKKAEQAAGAAKAGNRAIQKQFGSRTIAIYDGGFVRISRLLEMTPVTPYEQLKSIKYGEQVQDRSAFGAAWSGPLTSKQRRTLSLTIVTDRKVHTLSTEGVMLSGDDKAGRALEAAGQAILDDVRSAPGSPVSGPAPPPPDIADQIKKLADLHAAGILTDDEFATKKADLLGRM